MSNRRKSPVSYRKFQAAPHQRGLLAVARSGGDLERKVAAGFARLSEQFGGQADRAAELDGRRQGRMDAVAAAPKLDYSGSGSKPPAGIRVSTQDSNDSAAKARDYLISKHGLKSFQASAIAGHGMQESAFNTQAVGDNGTAFGVFQWRGDRAANLRAFAKKGGRDWQDMETQLDFMMTELQGSEGRAWQGLQNASNLQDAVTAFMHYERPQGYTVANPSAGHGYKNRLAYAQGLVGGGGASTPSAASVGPVRATPVDAGAPVRVASAGGFRPTGSDTIRGRAYDVAGTRTYLEQLDATLRQEQERVYEAYKDDPAMLQKAMGELKTAHMREHIFDEIAPEYSAAFDSGAVGYISKANKRAETRQLETDQADFLSRTEQLEEQKSRTVAGMDPDNTEEALVALEDQQQSIEAHYESAVVRNLMTPAKAAEAKSASRSRMMVGFYGRQMEGKSSSELDQMKEDLREDYAAGKLKGLDGDGFNVLIGELKARSKAKEIEDKKADSGLQKRSDELVFRMSRGETVAEDEIARFKLDAETAPKGEKISQSTFARMRVANAIRSRAISEVESDLEEILKGDGSATPLAEDIAFSRELIALHRKELVVDPIGVAERFGIIPVAASLPVGVDASMEGVKIAFEDRIDEAKLVAEHFGVQPRYIRPGEAAQILAQLDEDPAAGLDIAGGLVEAAGVDAPKLLRELGKEARPIAQAGAIMAVSGNSQAAMDAIIGSRKGDDGKMRKAPPEDTMRTQAATMFGSALTLHPVEAFRLSDTAANIARVRLEAFNIDPKSDDALPVFQQALHEAAGGTFENGLQYGGFANYDPGLFWSERRVLVPPSIRADKLQDVISAITDKDLEALEVKPVDGDGRPYSAAELKGAMLVATEGGFRFAAGDPESDQPRWYRGSDGRPFVLDVEALPQLQLRVPAAFKE
ncbi:phage tail tip lysozyme [Pseudovibrio sp. POLY-S9]|uniref:phage tail tip lysozyme n=1 Tax=Pseudovibrio sp. POLY-S9 TaxID=1576596 RepID=UPI0007106E2F|nr:phage tail tip lysozyme [Pseudovibrio sp. POLY-S9]